MSQSLLAFVAAFVASIVLTPLMRRIALRSGLVDHPAARKVHTSDVPYMGGVAIAAAALVGLLVKPGVSLKIGFLAFVAVVLGIVGLLDDDRTLPVRPRLVTQLAAAVAAVAVGIRMHPTGIAAWDIAITIVWIVGITNAMNLLDNMDGLAGGIGGAIAGGVFALAAFGHQDVVAAFAAGIGGACLGFLAYNWRPASIFMGDAGSLFLGFVLSVAALDLHPLGTQPDRLLVRVLLFGLPILDTATVMYARARRRVSVMQGGRDHLSHRLVALGLSPAVAVSVLVGVQFVLSADAVFLGRGVASVPVAAAIGAVTLGALAIACTRPVVYVQRIRGLPRAARMFLAAVVLAVAASLAIVAFVALAVRGRINTARTEVEQAIDALHRGDTPAAEAKFASAGREFRSVRGVLSSPVVSFGRLVPVVAPNLDASREVVSTGVRLTDAGVKLAHGIDPKRLEVHDGTVPVAEIDKVAPEVADAARLLRKSRDDLAHINRDYLLPVVSHGIDQLQERLDKAARDGDRVELATKVAPEIFGSHGRKRYFLAVQNSAELRATGGFIGNWGILDAENGHVTLERFERIGDLDTGGGDPNARVLHAPPDFVNRYARFGITTTWQNINFSPDFPTVAAVIKDLLPQSGGPQVDGVIAVDSSGLAALLQLTGPVNVPNWSEPITSANVVDVTLRDAYARFTDEGQRADFLGDVAHSVWSATTSTNLGAPQHIGATLADATDQGHMMVWFADKRDEQLADEIGAAGRVPRVGGDSLFVVTQNAAGNKADYYLHRHITYDVEVTPTSDGRHAKVEGRAIVKLDNGLPPSGLPRIVMGPYDERFAAGENRSFVSLYTPNGFGGATLNDRPVSLESADELGRHVYSSYVSMPAGTSATLSFAISGVVPITDSWYRLDVLRQPTLGPDDVTITIRVPTGWRIADTVSGHVDSERRTLTLREAMTSEFAVGARITSTHRESVLDRLRDGT